ncbi:MAG: hypothetical protein ACRDGA_00905, partial [Bacteroidota bacterium]
PSRRSRRRRILIRAKRKIKRFIDKWASEDDPAVYAKMRAKADGWAKEPEKHKLLNAAYKSTQRQLEKQGIESMGAFRGMALPSSHPLSQAIKSGRLKVGDEFEMTGTTVLSWSDSRDKAVNFMRFRGVKGDTGVVLSSNIDRKDVFMSHRTQKTLAGYDEREIIVRNPGKRRVRIEAIE